METQRTTITLEHAVTLVVSQELNLVLTDVVLTDVEGPILEGGVSPAVWSLMIREGLLGLDTMVSVGPGPEVVDADKAVRLRICPSDELEERYTLSELAHALIEGAAEVCVSDAWLLLEASQQVELPEGVEGEAFVGFKTAWPEPSEPSPLASAVFLWLEEVDMSPELLEPDLARVDLNVDGVDWSLLVRVDNEAELVGFYSVFPERIPEDARHDVALFLLGQNYDLATGSFEMDPEDGEVRFRTTWLRSGSALPTSEALFDTFAPHPPVVSTHVDATESLITMVREGEEA